MSIKEEVNSDFKEAFKAGNMQIKTVLAGIKSEIKNRELDKKGEELTDDEMISLISTEIKRRKDSQKQYEEGGREDLAKSEKEEIEILSKYMPKQLTEDEIKELVKKTISDVGAESMQDLGKVMAGLKDATKGKADGSVVSSIVREMLS